GPDSLRRESPPAAHLIRQNSAHPRAEPLGCSGGRKVGVPDACCFRRLGHKSSQLAVLTRLFVLLGREPDVRDPGKREYEEPQNIRSISSERSTWQRKREGH